MADSIRTQIRKTHMARLPGSKWDYVIVGSGIVGAQAFRRLADTGARTLLLDAKDFAGGTSSQSGMLIWGGLLYLKQGDIHSVAKFSKSRNQMMKSDLENVQPLPVRYVQAKRNPFISTGFTIYSWLNSKKRLLARAESRFPEQRILNGNARYSYPTEEALLQTSDARYVLDIIFSSLAEDSRALNYCRLVRGQRHGSLWEMEVADEILGETHRIQAHHIINCAGPASESVHALLGLGASPYKHVWSKGVYLCLKRPADLQSMLVIDLPEEKDVITYCPLQSTALWGPTEEKISNLAKGGQLTSLDVQWLARKYFQATGRLLERDEILSYRVGVRPLCVKSDYESDEYTLNISRRSQIYSFPEMKVTTFYGGKFTGSAETAQKLSTRLGFKSSSELSEVRSPWKNHLTSNFVQTAAVEPSWSLENEMCWHTEDYMRRRTSLHQTIANGGFGFEFENADLLREIAAKIFTGDPEAWRQDFNTYKTKQEQIDSIIRKGLYEE